MQAIYVEGAVYDLVISSAMDLQIKLANDGLIQTHRSASVTALPDWAVWRNEVFAFTSEPAVLVVSEVAFADIDVPQNRSELIQLLRDAPDAFRGRIGTYDTRTSGLGYLFATQDARNTESFWQLTEIMGGLDAQLYCCSGDMITDVAEGRLAMAYNVLGSYAAVRAADTPNLRVVELDDYVSVMLRTVVMPKSAPNPQMAGAMIDFLVSDTAQGILDDLGLSRLPVAVASGSAPPRTIRLGPGLLVFLDQLRREAFLRNWTGSIVQN
jgi:iron(III) transport system substrate-binding protein